MQSPPRSSFGTFPPLHKALGLSVASMSTPCSRQPLVCLPYLRFASSRNIIYTDMYSMWSFVSASPSQHHISEAHGATACQGPPPLLLSGAPWGGSAPHGGAAWSSRIGCREHSRTSCQLLLLKRNVSPRLPAPVEGVAVWAQAHGGPSSQPGANQLSSNSDLSQTLPPAPSPAATPDAMP